MTEDKTITIKCETEGFDEAQEEIEALADAYNEFPAQVNLKGLKYCTINIYANQTRIGEEIK
ncbi:hypothetical protein [Ruminococcus sp.]|uniref:hypothetical protein n=1 Tax=Ruminococcus sp. TaxID=41978 RepID=UPI00388DF67F